jgi:AhpD family alkylhydroperoxidase
MFEKTVREQMVKSIKYIQPIDYDAATGLTAAVFQQMQEDFLPAPLIALHSPVPELLAGVWSLLRETLLAGSVNRSHKEAVAATVSKTNECPFCVDAHTVMLRATADHDAADAILRGDYDNIHDSQLRALVQWVMAKRTANPDAVQQPFMQHDIPEIVGTAVAFHYLNRMANIFLGDALLPLPSLVKGLTYRVYAATAGKRVVRELQPGNSLKFVPAADLPNDLSWASGSPTVAQAFAGFAHVVDEIGTAFVPEPVRHLIHERLQAWNDESMGISRRWVDEAVAQLNEACKPMARLALLTAFASYQVDATVIRDFQSYYPEDAQLIATTAWASFAIARRVSAWLTQ